MAKKSSGQSVERGIYAASTSPAKRTSKRAEARAPQAAARPSSLLDTRVVYCGDNLEQLGPCRTGQFRGQTKKRRAFEDRHENTKAYPATAGRPRCVQLARVLKKTGSVYYHCDCTHYVKIMLDQIFGEIKFKN
jgi:hypothetical protein